MAIAHENMTKPNEESDKHKGGRLAANFRRANIAEGLAIQMFRPFAAVAPVPREEDFGVDLIATLLRSAGKCMIAENSFWAQVKIRTAAHFLIEGDGVNWLRQLKIPYFPVVVDLAKAELSLYTINQYLMPIFASVVSRYNFCVESEDFPCDGLDDFPLGEPLMRWSLTDCSEKSFPGWAYQILKPAVEIETRNLQYGPMRRFVALNGGPYEFDAKNPVVESPPRSGRVLDVPPGDGAIILDTLKNTLGPFAHWVANQVELGGHSDDLLQLRSSFRRLGLNPDPTNEWNEIAAHMNEYFQQNSPNEPDQPTGNGYG